MGRPKQLLLWERQPILVRSLKNLMGAQVDEVVLVLGHEGNHILQEIQKYVQTGFKVAMNPRYREGMSTSIQRGLQEIDPGSQAVLIALADQPLVESRTLNKIINAYGPGNYGIVVPAYQGRRGNPVLLSLKYKPEMLALTGDVGCRRILQLHPEEVLEVEVDSPGILKDIDTEADYTSFLSCIGSFKIYP
jgi:molybdenum cofactor cytidylyltransferase